MLGLASLPYLTMRNRNATPLPALRMCQVLALIGEMQAAIESEYGVSFEDGVPERLCAYARCDQRY